jgi:hypothetical protein
MSHVDEGTLHALLDGALEGTSELTEVQQHLAECAECRQRVEEAHALSARAASILDTAPAGEITTPPFTAVLARKRRGAARPRVFGMHRLTAIGWAATIVLAVGVGWLARGSLPLGGDADLQRRRPPSAQTAARDASDEARRSLANETEAEKSSVGAITGVEAEPQTSTGRQEQAAKSTTAPAAPPIVTADAAASGEAEELEGAGQTAPARADNDRSLAPAPAEVSAAEPLLREQARAARAAPEHLASRAFQISTTADWETSTAADGAALLGVPVRSVAGLDILLVETGTAAGIPAVRVTQQLGADSLVIVQYDAPADAAAREGLGAATRDEAGSVIVRRDGLVVVLQAPVSLDSLRRLAERLP